MTCFWYGCNFDFLATIRRKSAFNQVADRSGRSGDSRVNRHWIPFSLICFGILLGYLCLFLFLLSTSRSTLSSFSKASCLRDSRKLQILLHYTFWLVTWNGMIFCCVYLCLFVFLLFTFAASLHCLHKGNWVGFRIPESSKVLFCYIFRLVTWNTN